VYCISGGENSNEIEKYEKVKIKKPFLILDLKEHFSYMFPSDPPTARTWRTWDPIYNL
jgi:hypothetical protein